MRATEQEPDRQPSRGRSHGTSAAAAGDRGRKTSQLRPNNAEEGSPPPPDKEEPGKRWPANPPEALLPLGSE